MLENTCQSGDIRSVSVDEIPALIQADVKNACSQFYRSAEEAVELANDQSGREGRDSTAVSMWLPRGIEWGTSREQQRRVAGLEFGSR